MKNENLSELPECLCPLTLDSIAPVVLSQIRYGAGSDATTAPVEIELAIVEVVEEADETPCMLAADFFDDENLIVVYRAKNHSEFLALTSDLC